MNWWESTPKEVVAIVYWQREQLPPKDWEDHWPAIKAELMDQFPPPTGTFSNGTYVPVHLRNQAS